MQFAVNSTDTKYPADIQINFKYVNTGFSKPLKTYARISGSHGKVYIAITGLLGRGSATMTMPIAHLSYKI